MASGISRNGPQGTGKLRGPTRAVGFIVLAVPAMAVLALLVLAPAYANMVRTGHILAVKQAEIKQAATYAAANERLKAALPTDRTLTKRLALHTTSRILTPAQLVLPPEPSGLLLTTADRLTNPLARRTLLGIAVSMLVGSLLLFGGSSDPRQSIQTTN